MSERGIWGVGKHVFFRSSQISTIFGLTVRADDQETMLMGKTVIKSHWVGETYCQDGYFGLLPEGERELVMPIKDDSEIENFSSLFNLQRDTEPGLSLVVPWPDPEVTDQLLVQAVVRDYFYPILAGQLDVMVETPSIETVLGASSLVEDLRRIGGDVVRELLPSVELAEWVRELDDEQRVELNMPSPDLAWAWSDELIPPEVLESLSEAYQNGERAAIRVPVTVRKKNSPHQPSYFDIYMVRDNTEHAGRPTFIREGVIIPQVDTPRTRSVRAIVVAEDLPLAGFLRDAENPAHTEWQHNGSNFRGKYVSGVSDLKFVKRSVYEIVRILTEASAEEDKVLLVDFFSLPALPEQEEAVEMRVERPAEQEGRIPPPVPRDIPRRPQRFRLQKVSGGFSVLPGEGGSEPPEVLDIRVAYNIRRGNPLSKYNPADFRVDQAPIKFNPEPKGVDIECSENRIVARIRDSDFRLHVTGFDERRDLYVKAVAREDTNGGKKV
jgi:hypothetical protein